MVESGVFVIYIGFHDSQTISNNGEVTQLYQWTHGLSLNEFEQVIVAVHHTTHVHCVSIRKL